MRRWHSEIPLMNSRKKEYRRIEESSHYFDPDNYKPSLFSMSQWRKRHLWDCGKTKCLCCHLEKVTETKKRRSLWKKEAKLEIQMALSDWYVGMDGGIIEVYETGEPVFVRGYKCA